MAYKKFNKNKLEENRVLILQFGIFIALFAVLVVFNAEIRTGNENFNGNYSGINLETDTLPAAGNIKPPLPGIIEDASFPGGEDSLRLYFKKNLKYPHKAEEQNICGRVYVKFTVNQYGKTQNVKVIRKIHPLLDAEALRLIKNMPDWKPAKTENGPAESEKILPVVFLNKEYEK